MSDHPVLFRDCALPESKYYVYMLYLEDRPNPVYVGKGQGDRLRHYFYYPERVSNRILRRKLIDLKAAGKEYKVRIAFETDDEQEALDVESFYICSYGRVFDKSGFLFNFRTDDPIKKGVSPKRRKPVYIDGFVFDSISRAMSVTGIKYETIHAKVRSGRAAYLLEEAQVAAVTEREKKDKYSRIYRRRKKAIKRAIHYLRVSEANSGEKCYWWGKTTAVAKGITIDGVNYPSQAKAAKAFGYVRGHSLMKFLKKGKHNHVYELHD